MTEAAGVQPAVPAIWSRLKRLLPYFRGTGVALPSMIVATIIAALTEPAIPALMKPLLDQGFKGGSIDLWLVPLTLLGLFTLRGLAGFVAQYSLAYMANEAMVRLRQRLFARMLEASVSLFSHSSASTLSNTVVYEVQIGTTLLVNAMLSLLKDSLTLIALMAYLLFINWKLTLIVLVIFPAVAAVMRVLSRRLQRITHASQQATDRLAYVVEENVLAHRIVRLHAAQAAQSARFSRLSQELRRLAMKSTIAASAMTPLTQLLAASALSAVICIALWQSATSGITVGAFAAFITAMLMLIAPIKHLSEAAAPITRGLAAVERGLDLIEHTPVEAQGGHAIMSCLGDIRFENVSVQYPDSAQKAVNGVTLEIDKGQVLALVGASGSGKTTLANLLPRFVEPTEGRITLDGIPLGEWKLDSLRMQFAYVSQDVVMFNDSIAANVALGLEADSIGIKHALEAANLGEFIEALPDGIQTFVGHNAMQLSGGQRQRLAIARAIYKNAPVLVLDEATSALDSESEQAVKDALRRLMVGRTTLIIAHRLSTIEHADRIAVMSKGMVVESGSHAELMACDGHYAKLYRLATTGEVAAQEGLIG